MAIAIPAIVDTQLAALKASITPHTDSVTKTSAVGDLFPRGNRVADILDLLAGLIDSGTMTVQGIHGATDAADQTALANATDPATGYALSIDLKTVYNLHRVKTAGGVHGGADGANIVDAADADSEAKLITLSNQIKAKLNAHFVYQTGNTHRFSDVKEVITAANATNFATCYVLLNEVKTKYNAHCIDIGCSSHALADTAAFTGVNSLVGAKITFGPATTTVALRNAVAYVVTNTVNQLNFSSVLLGTPVSGDVYAIEFTAVDAELEVVKGGKGKGESQSNPYGYGPTMVSAMVKLIEQLGGAVPTWLKTDPFTIGSPHAGGSAGGHGGAQLFAAALQLVRDTVALYTKPA